MYWIKSAIGAVVNRARQGFGRTAKQQSNKPAQPQQRAVGKQSPPKREMKQTNSQEFKQAKERADALKEELKDNNMGVKGQHRETHDGQIPKGYGHDNTNGSTGNSTSSGGSYNPERGRSPSQQGKGKEGPSL